MDIGSVLLQVSNLKRDTHKKNEAPTFLRLPLQEFYDEWPVKLGDVEPYKGPKTPDGRVIKTSLLLTNDPLNEWF